MPVGDLRLATIGVIPRFRQFAPVVVTAFEIHLRVAARRIPTQHPVNDDQRLDTVFPRDFPDRAQTSDASAHGRRIRFLGSFDAIAAAFVRLRSSRTSFMPRPGSIARPTPERYVVGSSQRGKRRFAEFVGGASRKPSATARTARDIAIPGVADVGLTAHLRISEVFRSSEYKSPAVVIEPAGIVGLRRVRRGRSRATSKASDRFPTLLHRREKSETRPRWAARPVARHFLRFSLKHA